MQEIIDAQQAIIKEQRELIEDLKSVISQHKRHEQELYQAMANQILELGKAKEATK